MTKAAFSASLEHAGIAPGELGEDSNVAGVNALRVARYDDMAVCRQLVGRTLAECAKDATRDPKKIIESIAENPQSNWYLPTGPENGFAVLYFHRQRDEVNLLADWNLERLPSTRAVCLPGSGACQYWFRVGKGPMPLPGENLHGTHARFLEFGDLPGNLPRDASNLPAGGTCGARFIWAPRTAGAEIATLPRQILWSVPHVDGIRISANVVVKPEFDSAAHGAKFDPRLDDGDQHFV